MSNWNEMLDEIKSSGGTLDILRRKYLKHLANITGRNVIAYYSGWLQYPNIPGTAVNDSDKNGLMTTINKLDRSKGLDLLLHTPGGETAATESLVDYLRSMFGDNIRAIIPQLALSAGTMIACAGKSIIMGKHSSLGPIDPMYSGLSAHGVIEEFTRAAQEITQDQSKIPIWQPILAKYPPTLIGECQKSIAWSEQMVTEWLKTGMFKNDRNKASKAQTIIDELGNHALTLSHARHLSAKKCKEIGLKVDMLEDDQRLQDAVLSVHHAFIHTFSATPAFKIIENHKGVAMVQIQQTILVK